MKNAFANLAQTNVNTRKARKICMIIAFCFDPQLVAIVASEVKLQRILSQYIDRKKNNHRWRVIKYDEMMMMRLLIIIIIIIINCHNK